MSTNMNRGLAAKLLGLTSMGMGMAALALWYIRPVSPWRDQDDEAAAASLLRAYLPSAEFMGEVSVVIHAMSHEIVAAMQRVTLNDMPLAMWLGKLRYLPAHLTRGSQSTQADDGATPFLQLIQSEGGNLQLAERPGAEYVLGAIGKFHNLQDQHFVPLQTPHDFVDFDDPDYQKLAMSFIIEPLAEGSGYRLRLVHGTQALSSHARWKFSLYWLVIKPSGNFVAWLMLRAIKAIAESSSQRTMSVRGSSRSSS